MYKRSELLKIAKPIPFCTDMVIAVRRDVDPKTMTRRVVKQKYSNTTIELVNGDLWEREIVPPPEKLENGMTRHHVAAVERIKPLYQVGGIYYVKETYRNQTCGPNGETEIEYKADFTEGDLACYGRRGGYAPCKWISSRFMPKAAARTFIRITAVKAERLQDISYADICKEGLTIEGGIVGGLFEKSTYLRLEYKALWDKLNAKRGHSWDVNDWVYAYTFERIKEIDMAA